MNPAKRLFRILQDNNTSFLVPGPGPVLVSRPAPLWHDAIRPEKLAHNPIRIAEAAQAKGAWSAAGRSSGAFIQAGGVTGEPPATNAFVQLLNEEIERKNSHLALLEEVEDLPDGILGRLDRVSAA